MEIKRRQYQLSKIGYGAIAVSLIGFFAYYAKSADRFYWYWLVLLGIGLGCLIFKDFTTEPTKRKKVIVGDIIYLVVLGLLSQLALPYGLNFLLIALLAIGAIILGRQN